MTELRTTITSQRAAANAQAVMRYYEGPWERGAVDLLDDLHTAGFVGHGSGMPDFDLEGLRELIISYRKAFSDFRIFSEDVVATDDAVVVRWRSKGRFTGGWMGSEPSGEVVAISGITIYRFEGDRIAEHWTEFDSLGFLNAIVGESSASPA